MKTGSGNSRPVRPIPMDRESQPIRDRRRTLPLLPYLLFLITASLWIYSPVPSGLAESELAPRVEAVSARFTVTLIRHDGGEVVFGGQYYRHGSAVRFEPDGTPGKDLEVQLIDTERQLFYRIFPNEQVYFEQRLTPAQLYKAVQQGWTPTPEAWSQNEILLKEEPWEGHPADLYLVIRKNPFLPAKDPQRDYALIWLARDLKVPLRLAYVDPQSHPIIVEFQNLKTENMDGRLFRPPSEYANLNPY